jgi:hypothetical protein
VLRRGACARVRRRGARTRSSGAGLRPFVCKGWRTCSATFAKAGTLKKHFDSIHQGKCCGGGRARVCGEAARVHALLAQACGHLCARGGGPAARSSRRRGPCRGTSTASTRIRVQQYSIGMNSSCVGKVKNEIIRAPRHTEGVQTGRSRWSKRSRCAVTSIFCVCICICI